MTESRTWDPSYGRLASDRLRHGADNGLIDIIYLATAIYYNYSLESNPQVGILGLDLRLYQPAT